MYHPCWIFFLFKKKFLQYEFNARTQVTMWYDTNITTQSKLHDYGNFTAEIMFVLWLRLHFIVFITWNISSPFSANKFWSGLLVDYYLPRASTYFDYMSKSLREKSEFQVDRWRQQWVFISISWQSNWKTGTKNYPIRAKGDSIAIAKALYDKYFGQQLIKWAHHNG